MRLRWIALKVLSVLSATKTVRRSLLVGISALGNAASAKRRAIMSNARLIVIDH